MKKKSIYVNNFTLLSNEEKKCYELIGIAQTKSKSNDANHTDTNRYACGRERCKKVKATIIENGHHLTAHCLAHIQNAIKLNSRLTLNVNRENSRELPKLRFDEGHQHRAYARTQYQFFGRRRRRRRHCSHKIIMNCSIHSHLHGLKRRKSNETKIKVVNFSLAAYVCSGFACAWRGKNSIGHN